MLYNCNPISIDIRLDPGVYCMGTTSGTGKTYIAKKLKEMSTVCNVMSYTLTDVNKPESVLNNSYDILMFDRADMYMTEELLDKILIDRKSKVVLLDLKHNNYKLEDWCYVNLTEDKVIVAI